MRVAPGAKGGPLRRCARGGDGVVDVLHVRRGHGEVIVDLSDERWNGDRGCVFDRPEVVEPIAATPVEGFVE